MILRNPLPDPDLIRRFNEVDTLREIPAIPALVPKRSLPQPDDWTPPPYWKNLLHMEESKFEQACKKWFFRVITIAMLLYVLAIASIFLGKLLVLVINLK